MLKMCYKLTVQVYKLLFCVTILQNMQISMHANFARQFEHA